MGNSHFIIFSVFLVRASGLSLKSVDDLFLG